MSAQPFAGRQAPVLLVLLLLLALGLALRVEASGGLFHQASEEQEQRPTAVGPYGDSAGSVFVGVMREFFNEINWKKIAEARGEVVKFIQAADRLLRAFRSQAGPKQAGSKEAQQDKRIFSSPWWSLGSKAAKDTLPPLSAADSTQVKAMLERVACFVGYMRLLTHTQEALAELDATKVLTNLFGADKGPSNSSGYFSHWFG